MKKIITTISLILILVSVLKSQDNIDLVIENQVISESLSVKAA